MARFRRITPPCAAFEDALGIADPFEPQLTRLPLAPGDLVLAGIDCRSITSCPPDHVRRILDRGADERCQSSIGSAGIARSSRCVLLSCFEPEAESPPDFLTHAGDAVTATATSDLAPAVGETAALSRSRPASAPGAGAMHHSRSAASICRGGRSPTRCARSRRRRRRRRQRACASAAANATPRYKRSTGAGMVPQFRIPKLALLRRGGADRARPRRLDDDSRAA